MCALPFLYWWSASYIAPDGAMTVGPDGVLAVGFLNGAVPSRNEADSIHEVRPFVAASRSSSALFATSGSSRRI